MSRSVILSDGQGRVTGHPWLLLNRLEMGLNFGSRGLFRICRKANYMKKVFLFGSVFFLSFAVMGQAKMAGQVVSLKPEASDFKPGVADVSDGASVPVLRIAASDYVRLKNTDFPDW